jgi:hypothetical protein
MSNLLPLKNARRDATRPMWKRRENERHMKERDQQFCKVRLYLHESSCSVPYTAIAIDTRHPPPATMSQFKSNYHKLWVIHRKLHVNLLNIPETVNKLLEYPQVVQQMIVTHLIFMYSHYSSRQPR